MNDPISELTPRRVVAELDRFIIGQDQAKRAVAIAVRNRWRRLQIPEPLQHEVVPRNILMMGPTGVGKTEIARRLARLISAPFIKVETTRFTEVGYVGRDVEAIVRDLTEAAASMIRAEHITRTQEEARTQVEERLVDILLPEELRNLAMTPGAARGGDDDDAGAELPEGITVSPITGAPMAAPELTDRTRRSLLTRLRAGDLEDRPVTVSVEEKSLGGTESMGAGFEQLGFDIRDFLDRVAPGRRRSRRVPVREARTLLEDEICAGGIDKEAVSREAVARTESSGIVFLDEIDKIASRAGSSSSGPDVSREGVQRDLLPIVEGCAVPTRHGTVRTDHILFIASGAFHMTDPSDLVPELQGRFPIRVSLDPLRTEDLYRILAEPENALPLQYAALMRTEGIDVRFQDDALKEIAGIAAQLNMEDVNLGARRLPSLIEHALEDIAFNSPERGPGELRIDRAFIRERLLALLDAKGRGDA